MYKFLVIPLIALLFMSCNNKPEKKPDSKPQMQTNSKEEIKTILFFGNSLTAGYGLDDPMQAFPALIQHKIDSAGLPYKVINAGLSGETTAGGVNRIDWLLKQKVDVFVLELGANDGLRGIPVAETTKNLQLIIDKVETKYPSAKMILLGMKVPPNMGGSYAKQFQSIFGDIAAKNNMEFVPFMLEGVAGHTTLNLRDGVHPTAEGYKIVAENVWSVLKNVL